MSQRFDVLVIGCGVAGLSAAGECLRHGLTTATLESFFAGGLVLNVNHLDGEIQGSGFDLASKLMSDVVDMGGQHIQEAACSMRLDDNDIVVSTATGELHARAVIVASGAKIKRLGIPGESEHDGQGVSQCADCDGPLFQAQDVVVVGGGDSALQEALALSQYARQVQLLHRGATFRARASYVQAVSSEPKITVRFRTIAEAVLGGAGVEAVRVTELDTGKSYDIPCAGFFAYVGLHPACDYVPAAIARDTKGFLITGPGMRTALPGVYAAGAVRSGNGGSLSDAIADGIAAANSARVQLADATPA